MLLVFHFLFGVVQQPLSFGIRQRPTLPGVSHPCCIDPGNSHSRAFRSLPAIPDAPPACFLHRRRQAPVPQGAHGEKPSQVQCCTHPETARKQLSPGRFSPCCIAHRARMGKNLAKYNVHSSGAEPKRKKSRIPNEKPQTFVWGFHLESGNVLLSRAVSSQVPSALKGLTSVFGMGTGGSLSP